MNNEKREGRSLRKVLLNLWTLPNTLLGLFFGITLTWSLPFILRIYTGWGACDSVIAFSSGRGVSRWMSEKLGVIATTFGVTVIFWDALKTYDPALINHEREHVEQYRHLGPFFLPLYLICLAFYWNRIEVHPLEKAAYRRSSEKGKRQGDRLRRGLAPCLAAVLLALLEKGRGTFGASPLFRPFLNAQHVRRSKTHSRPYLLSN